MDQCSASNRSALQQCGYDSDSSSSCSVVAPSWEPFSDCDDDEEDDEWSDIADGDTLTLEGDFFEDDLNPDCPPHNEGIELKLIQITLQLFAETSNSSALASSSSLPPTILMDTTRSPDGFVVVGDNIDQNVRPSFQRGDFQTESWHCFHSYAVANRVDVTHLSDTAPSAIITPDNILPNNDDLLEIYKDFEVLVSRYVCSSVVYA